MRNVVNAGIGRIIHLVSKLLAMGLVIIGLVTTVVGMAAEGNGWVVGVIMILLGAFVAGAGSYLADKLEGMSRHSNY